LIGIWVLTLWMRGFERFGEWKWVRNGMIEMDRSVGVAWSWSVWTIVF
jgi:hypothetical protein